MCRYDRFSLARSHIYGTARFKLDAREHCIYPHLKVHVSRAHNHEHAFFANLHANEIPRE